VTSAPQRSKVEAASAERMKRWWLKRYTLEELRELGRGLPVEADAAAKASAASHNCAPVARQSGPDSSGL